MSEHTEQFSIQKVSDFVNKVDKADCNYSLKTNVTMFVTIANLVEIQRTDKYICNSTAGKALSCI